MCEFIDSYPGGGVVERRLIRCHRAIKCDISKRRRELAMELRDLAIERRKLAVEEAVLDFRRLLESEAKLHDQRLHREEEPEHDHHRRREDNEPNNNNHHDHHLRREDNERDHHRRPLREEARRYHNHHLEEDDAEQCVEPPMPRPPYSTSRSRYDYFGYDGGGLRERDSRHVRYSAFGFGP